MIYERSGDANTAGALAPDALETAQNYRSKWVRESILSALGNGKIKYLRGLYLPTAR